MSAKLKLNSDYLFTVNDDKVKIINVENVDDENVVILEGLAAQVFVKIAEHNEEIPTIKQFLQGVENCPPDDEVEEFLNNFVSDLKTSGILQEA
jgi:hypothetical protein